ncbi:MAG: hypothetical protein QM790_00975 [Nibricoccus sp.]
MPPPFRVCVFLGTSRAPRRGVINETQKILGYLISIAGWDVRLCDWLASIRDSRPYGAEFVEEASRAKVKMTIDGGSSKRKREVVAAAKSTAGIPISAAKTPDPNCKAVLV